MSIGRAHLTVTSVDKRIMGPGAISNSYELYTHAGTFHADEVFGTVILMMYYTRVNHEEAHIIVHRVRNIPEDCNGDIIYDIGGGEFDHHQEDFDKVHPGTTIPYAACGLLWDRFGKDVCRSYVGEHTELVPTMFKIILNDLIIPIDAVDSGVACGDDLVYQPMTVSGIISAYNPAWNDTGSEYFTENNCFDAAITTASSIFGRYLRYAEKIAAARVLIADGLRKMDNHIMILDRQLPWMENIYDMRDDPELAKKIDDLLFVVYPGKRGDWQWRTVPVAKGSFEARKYAPKAWAGLKGEDLERVCGVKGATFCHNNLFIGGAKTEDAAIEMAWMAQMKDA